MQIHTNTCTHVNTKQMTYSQTCQDTCAHKTHETHTATHTCMCKYLYAHIQTGVHTYKCSLTGKIKVHQELHWVNVAISISNSTSLSYNPANKSCLSLSLLDIVRRLRKRRKEEELRSWADQRGGAAWGLSKGPVSQQILCYPMDSHSASRELL